MKILKNIHQVILYYHLCGDIDISDYLYLSNHNDPDKDEYIKLGYNIYYDNSCPEELVKNSVYYQILANEGNIFELYKYLKTNEFITSKFNVELGETSRNIDYKYIISFDNWNMIYFKYNTLGIKDSFITFY